MMRTACHDHPAKSGRRRWVLTAALAVCLLVSAGAHAQDRKQLKIGDAPPRFTLRQLDGREVTVPDDLAGKVVILHFWADWCQYCLEEMPALDSLYQQYGKKGLAVYAVNVGQGAAAAKAFVDKVRITYPVLLDSDSRTARQYSVVGLPRTFFLDRQGRIKYKLLGDADKDTLRKLIQNML